MAPKFQTKPAGSILTLWKMKTYDVWGNAKDGYDVNDVYSHGNIELRIPQTRYNVGTSAEFVGAYPGERQLKQVFGFRGRIEVDGDDLEVRVDRARDGYPMGELSCLSHESLSPVRLKPGVSRDPKDGWSGV
jgi:hypothetical protein